MARRPHFVEDYERLVDTLVATCPLDEAMSLAVGGDFEAIGQRMVGLLRNLGLAEGMQVVDFGCGSGRLAAALGRTLNVQYTGIDVVPKLLEYAKAHSPEHYRFHLNQQLSFPVRSDTCDFIAAFSVFTHLHAPETYVCLVGMAKALKSGGRLVFSYLDVSEPNHWDVFNTTAEGVSRGTSDHLNAFIARGWIDVWAEKLGLDVERHIEAREAPWGGEPLGQAVAVLRKPASA